MAPNARVFLAAAAVLLAAACAQDIADPAGETLAAPMRASVAPDTTPPDTIIEEPVVEGPLETLPSNPNGQAPSVPSTGNEENEAGGLIVPDTTPAKPSSPTPTSPSPTPTSPTPTPTRTG